MSDMQMCWRRLPLFCPNCKTEAVITAIFCSSDGEILVKGICAPCGHELAYKTTGTELVRMSFEKDLRDYLAQHNPKALPPPLFTDQDKKELHDFHIILPDEDERNAA